MRRAAVPYGEFVALARRHARRAGETEDIVQEVLVAAVASGRTDFSLPSNRRWLAGAIRRRAAFDARSAARRRQRETGWQAGCERTGDPPEAYDISTVLDGLAKGQRIVAALALSGHTRVEIAYLLGLSDAALRQRIRDLRKALAKRDSAMPAELAGLRLDLAYGSIREALASVLRRHGGMFATHDPDGHLIVMRRSS